MSLKDLTCLPGTMVFVDDIVFCDCAGGQVLTLNLMGTGIGLSSNSTILSEWHSARGKCQWKSARYIVL